MVLRFLIRYLANNERLVQRLSESYPIRKAAQIFVRVVFSGKNFIEERRLHEKLTPEQFQLLMRDLSVKLRKQIQDARKQFEKKMKQ